MERIFRRVLVPIDGSNCSMEAGEREGIRLEKLIEEGTPHRVIVDIAERERVDLILIGKVGRRGPIPQGKIRAQGRILIGSVTERVIEAAKCPVLVMRAD